MHTVGIVIGPCVIGDNVTIYQNVTIGKRGIGYGEVSPVIGDGVTIYAGAVVTGPIRIGNNAIIGANSVVLKDVPDGVVVAGVPAKVVSQIPS